MRVMPSAKRWRTPGWTRARVGDVVMGCSAQLSSQGYNIGRLTAIAAGLPETVPGMTVDRMCASGLMAIAMADRQVRDDGLDMAVAGGVESISLVQTKHKNTYRAVSQTVTDLSPHMYMPMIETAEVVADRYGISRAAQDAFAAESQQRTVAAQNAGRFDAELAPMTTVKKEKTEDGELIRKDVTLTQDEGMRAGTTAEKLAALGPVYQGGTVVKDGKFITAGNSSQLSDGASALVLVSDVVAKAEGLAPLGAFRGMAVAGCAPEEMGIGPVFAVPKLLKRHGLTVDDIDLWELNEALYCRDHLGIDPAKLNVDGGAIAVGHPFGMTGARLAGHILIEG